MGLNMLTELEQRANDEARHAHRELVESMALDYLAAAGQAAEAYQAQLAAEARLAKAVEFIEIVEKCGNGPLWDLARTTLAELTGSKE